MLTRRWTVRAARASHMSPPAPPMPSTIMCHRAWRKESRTDATDSGRRPLSLSSWRDRNLVSAAYSKLPACARPVYTAPSVAVNSVTALVPEFHASILPDSVEWTRGATEIQPLRFADG